LQGLGCVKKKEVKAGEKPRKTVIYFSAEMFKTVSKKKCERQREAFRFEGFLCLFYCLENTVLE